MSNTRGVRYCVPCKCRLGTGRWDGDRISERVHMCESLQVDGNAGHHRNLRTSLDDLDRVKGQYTYCQANARSVTVPGKPEKVRIRENSQKFESRA